MFHRFATTAEGLVKRDKIDRNCSFTLHHLVLGLVERPLGFQHVDQIRQAIGVKSLGQIQRILAGGHRLCQRIVAGLFLGISDHRVFHNPSAGTSNPPSPTLAGVIQLTSGTSSLCAW